MWTARGRAPRSRHPGARSSRSRSQCSAAGVCWTTLPWWSRVRSAGGEGAAHLVGEPERAKILHVAGGALQIATRSFREEGYGLVGVCHPANAQVMLEVETLEEDGGLIRATHLLC